MELLDLNSFFGPTFFRENRFHRELVYHNSNKNPILESCWLKTNKYISTHLKSRLLKKRKSVFRPFLTLLKIGNTIKTRFSGMLLFLGEKLYQSRCQKIAKPKLLFCSAGLQQSAEELLGFWTGF